MKSSARKPLAGGRGLCGVASFVVAASLLATASPTQAQSFRRDAGVAFTGQSLANPRGALSASTNPAGLTDLWSWETRLQLSGGGGFVGGQKGNGLGIFFASSDVESAWAVAWERVNHGLGEPGDNGTGTALNRFSVAGGWRLTDSLRFGYALRVHASGEVDTASPLSIDLGALYRPWSWVSLGARATGLAFGSFGDGRRIAGFPHTRWGLGFAVRPFAGSDRLTIAWDADWPAGDTLGDVTWSLASRIVDGLSVMLEHRNASQNRTTGLSGNSDQRTSLLVNLGFGTWGGDLSLLGTESQVKGGGGGIQLGARLSGDRPHAFGSEGPTAVIVRFRGGFSEEGDRRHFTEQLLKLHRLSERRGVKLIVIKAEGMRLTWAQVEELRAWILKTRGLGKKIAMYADSLGTRGYTVAAACDKIGLPEYGVLSMHGVGTSFMGLKEAIARLGIQVQAVRFGDHKSAPEQFTRTELSDQFRTTLQRLVNKRWRMVAEAVALGRQMTTTEVEARLLQGAAYPKAALKAGFIDAVGSGEQFEKKLRNWKLLPPRTSLRRASDTPRRPSSWAGIPRIAVVSVVGTIVGGRSSSSLRGKQVGGAQIGKRIRNLTGRSEIKAIAVRVDSGGGSVAGSDIMYKAMRKAAKRKPVFASMGSVAASGGYWTAIAGDRVFADASTVTGSIGIFTIKPDVSGLWRKLGVGITRVGAGPMPSFTSTNRPWTPREIALMRKTLKGFYGLFLTRVKTRRKIDHARLLTLAEGRIWLGSEALRYGLIDEIGGIETTLTALKNKAAIDDEDVPIRYEYWPQPSLETRVRRTLGLAQAKTPSVLTDPVFAELVAVLQPWLDAAVLAGVLEKGRPLAIAPVPPSRAQP